MSDKSGFSVSLAPVPAFPASWLPLFLALFLALASFGCTPGAPGTHGGLPGDDQQAQNLWASFCALSASPQPSRTDGSLRFGLPNDTRRVTYLLWNNGHPPLRLDVQAGPGVMAASIEVDGDTVLAYLPGDKKAYIGTDSPAKALRSLGLPMPISVAGLNSLLQGRYLEALGNPTVLGHTPSLSGDGTVYRVDGDYGPSTVELSARALPVRWIFPQSWDLSIAYDENGLPARLEALLPAGAPSNKGGQGEDYRVILLVKKRQFQTPYAPKDLRLTLPPGTPVYDLDL